MLSLGHNQLKQRTVVFLIFFVTLDWALNIDRGTGSSHAESTMSRPHVSKVARDRQITCSREGLSVFAFGGDLYAAIIGEDETRGAQLLS